MLHDRRDLIAIGGDKLRMKAYAQSKADVRLPQVLWHGRDLGEVWNRKWEQPWVLKPIGDSGSAVFGTGALGDVLPDRRRVAMLTSPDIHRLYGEWAYSRAQEGFLLEQRLPSAAGELPCDYRMFVFDGVVRVIQYDTPRVYGVRRRFYSPDWQPLDVRQGGKPLAELVPPPITLQEMLHVGARLGAEYDFVRVDVYEADAAVWFGELTVYPCSGLVPFDPPGFDEVLGSFWQLPISAVGSSPASLPELGRLIPGTRP